MKKVVIANSKIKTREAIDSLIEIWNEFKYVKVEYTYGKKNTLDQYAILHEIYKRLADEYHAGEKKMSESECKLNFGIQILVDENEQFRRMYEKVVAPHSYETKLQIMHFLPVCREMKSDQLAKYIDKIFNFYAREDFQWNGLDQESERKRYKQNKENKK